MQFESIILDRLKQERFFQEALFSPEQDDAKTPAEWVAVLTRHVGLATPDTRQVDVDHMRWERQMIRVAATAIAALESHYRKHMPTEKVFSMKEGSGF